MVIDVPSEISEGPVDGGAEQQQLAEPDGEPPVRQEQSRRASDPHRHRQRVSTSGAEQDADPVDAGAARAVRGLRATPKGILKLMNSDGLTIYHIKSHLQKYRMAKYMPAPSSSSSSSEGTTTILDLPITSPFSSFVAIGLHACILPGSDTCAHRGMHITEALRVQLDVQRRLHEQLEIQRKLQVRIEEQGKRLQKMFEDQLKVSGNTAPAAAETPSEQEEDTMFVDVIDDDDEVQIISVTSGSYDDDLAL
ncbi:Myb family transcription factor APL [Triticum urartu]|uniref:Myb family transcription factor APL n=1 Tax=Triticum urartu TaxID=4572 RepID=M8AYK2_TRIUA|nr:Myb family transcription factor APL [Triticum urartu]